MSEATNDRDKIFALYVLRMPISLKLDYSQDTEQVYQSVTEALPPTTNSFDIFSHVSHPKSHSNLPS